VHLQPGDPVRVRDFDRDGRIVRLRLDQHRAEVDVGAFTVEVPLGEVLPPQTPAPPPKPRPAPPAPVRRAPKPRPPQPRAIAPPGAARAPGAPRPPAPHESPPQPALPSLSDEQALALKPMDPVYVQRFRRAGRVVRVTPAKKLVLVDVGLLEVEVPFDGLALPAAPKAPRPPHPKPAPRESAALGPPTTVVTSHPPMAALPPPVTTPASAAPVDLPPMAMPAPPAPPDPPPASSPAS